jgi:hypothetical protein
VVENRVFRRIFGPKMEEEKWEWSKLYNEELNYLYSSVNSIRVIKSRKMRLSGNVVRMGDMRSVYRILFGKPK